MNRLTDGFDGPCLVCGKVDDNCICPECPVCDSVGDSGCYEHHGMVRSPEQIESMGAVAAAAKAEAEAMEAAEAGRCKRCGEYNPDWNCSEGACTEKWYIWNAARDTFIHINTFFVNAPRVQEKRFALATLLTEDEIRNLVLTEPLMIGNMSSFERYMYRRTVRGESILLEDTGIAEAINRQNGFVTEIKRIASPVVTDYKFSDEVARIIGHDWSTVELHQHIGAAATLEEAIANATGAAEARIKQWAGEYAALFKQ